MYTVEPPIMDTLRSGQPPYNGHTVHPLPIYYPYISTSEEGTTSEQWTKCSSPKCPLFGGSTVYVPSGPGGNGGNGSTDPLLLKKKISHVQMTSS